jgi:hypothetical protein
MAASDEGNRRSPQKLILVKAGREPGLFDVDVSSPRASETNRPGRALAFMN